MRKSLFGTVLFFCFSLLAAREERKIVILHTNDLHSRLNGYAPETAYSPLITNNDNTAGGFARIASLIKEEKAVKGRLTLAVDGGDFLMGTLFHSLEVKTGFQLRLMKKMGYDVVCLGNHEFDFGPEKLASIINSSLAGGDIPSVLLGNILFDKTDKRDDSLEKLFAENFMRRKLIIKEGGISVGFFSLIGKDAADVAPMAEPIRFSKQVSYARSVVRELQDEGCDIIICLSHSGLTLKEGTWTGEDVEIAKSVKGINLIISAHTHSRLEEPLIADGVPIVQAGEYGQFIGRIELSLNNGSARLTDCRMIAVDDKISGDASIQQMIDNQKDKVTAEILQPLGLTYDKPVGESGFLLECNEQGNFSDSNLGPLVADAIHYYVNKHTKQGSAVSLVAVGVIRDRIIPGVQTAADIFRIMSLGSGSNEVPGYPLARLYVTGKELKSILEILQVAYKSAPANYCFYSGISVVYNPGKGLLKKIEKIEIIHPDGVRTAVDYSKKNKTLYPITANSYMLEFIGIIKKMSFGLINVVPKDESGQPVTDMKKSIIDINENIPGTQEGKEWLALIEYIATMNDIDSDGIADIDKKYSVPVRTFFLSGN